VRYLALGDSYTAGEGVPPGEGFPAQLRRCCPALSDIVVIARTGWTTGELLAAIAATPPEGSFDLVTLLAGVNNQFRGQPIAGYEADMERLVRLALGHAAGDPRRVVVLSIPDWGVTPFAAGRDRGRISGAIDQFNRVARSVATRAGAAWVDVTTDSREHPHDLVADGLHPSAEAYTRWARLVCSQVPGGNE
jgi:lysophospholipase L1-like esterase